MSKRLALLIGNVRYQDGRLCAPVSGRELTALADALRDPKIGQFDEVFVQVNNTAVEAQLAIAEFFEESKSPHDTLLIYFAGQVLHHNKQPYLAQWDTFTEQNVQATTIESDYLRRRLSLASARQKLFVLDACVSNMLPDGAEMPEDDTWLIEAFSAADIVTMTAVRPFSAEAEESTTSRFTPALINALTLGEAEANEDGVITVHAWYAAAEAAAGEAGQRTHLTNEAAAGRLVIAAASEKQMAALPIAPQDSEGQSDGRKKWLVVALLVLLLLFIGGGGLFATGFLGQTAEAEPTAANIAVIATEAPTETPSKTPTFTAVPTDTATPTGTATKPGDKPVETPEPSSTPLLEASPTVTSTSPLTPTVTVSPTVSSVGVYVVRQRIFMRNGPAINFRITEYLDQGTAVTVLGRTPSGEWFNIELDDGRTGWVFSEMVESEEEQDPEEVPEVATIPAATNEFYDFSAGSTDEGLTIAVSHVYVGSVGPNATFKAELVPATNLIAAEYEQGNELGLGQFVVNFSRVGEGDYTSTAVRLCMVSPTGAEFFCETFPTLKEW